MLVGVPGALMVDGEDRLDRGQQEGGVKVLYVVVLNTRARASPSIAAAPPPGTYSRRALTATAVAF